MKALAGVLRLNLTMSFGMLVALGAWAGAILVIAATRGRLG